MADTGCNDFQLGYLWYNQSLYKDKKVPFLASIFVLAVVPGCNPYNKITFSSNKLCKQKEVAENIKEYDVNVHDNART